LFFIKKGLENGFVISRVRLAEKIAEFWLSARLSTTVKVNGGEASIPFCKNGTVHAVAF
jgi:hypothetical protein